MFFYDENPVPYTGKPVPYTGKPVSYDEQDATAHYIRHYSNYKMLKLFEQKDPDFRNRAQASREIAICEKKMQHWMRHPNFEQSRVEKMRDEIDRQWRTR